MIEYPYFKLPVFNNYNLNQPRYFEYNYSKEKILKEYLENFIKSFQLNILKQYTLINRDKIIKFILDHYDLIELIYNINPLLLKYFPNYNYYMEFVLDPEFESLNQLIIYIHDTDSNNNFDINWNKLEKIREKIEKIDISNNEIKKFLDLDLW